MTGLTEKLSSLFVTTITLVVLMLWFVWGMTLTGVDAFSRDFDLMNSILVRDWLIADENGFGLVKIWFIGLCLIMFFLGVNLVFCTWNKIIKIMKISFNGPKFLMMAVHIMFGLVALCHFGGFMLGFEHEKLPLRQGDRFPLEQDYAVELVRVEFSDDYSILRKSRRDLVSGEFHHRSNFAEVALYHGNTEVQRGRVFILKPLHYDDIQITLKRFTPPRPGGKGKEGHKVPGVVLAVTKNPVIGLFLVVYPLMILGIALYLVMTWKRKS